MPSLYLKNNTNTKTIFGILLVVAFTVSLFVPLFFGKLFFDGDAITYDYPAFSFYKNAIEKGGSTILNPYYFGGFPMAISPVGSFIDPLNRALLFVIPDFIHAYHVRFFISIALALLCSYFFGRKTGLGPRAALLLAFLYLLGQTVNNLTSGLINSGSVFLLPALLLAIQLIHESNTRKAFVKGALFGFGALFLGFLSGFLQTVFYTLIFAGSYALFIGWKEKNGQKNIGRWKGFMGYISFGIAAALPAYFLMRETFLFRNLTPRIEGFAAQNLDGLTPFDIFYFFIPDHVSIPFLSSEQALGLFIGVPALFFAFVSIFYFRKEDKLVSFSTGAYGIALLAVIVPLGIPWLLAHLPVFSWFHSIKRLLLPAVFFLAYLAAFGFERVSNNPDFLKGKKWFTKSALLISSLPLLFVLFFNVMQSFIPLQDPVFLEKTAQKLYLLKGGNVAQFALEKVHYVDVFTDAVQTLTQTFSFSNWPLILLFFIAPIPSIFFYLHSKNRIDISFFSWATLGVIMGTVLLSFVGVFGDYVSREALLQPSPLAETLHVTQKDKGGYAMGFLTGEGVFRGVATQDLSPDERTRALADLVRPNLNVVYKVKRLDGYEPYQTARMAHLWNEVIASEKFFLGDDAFEAALSTKKKEFLSKLPLLSSYGVGYIITPYVLSHPFLSLATTTAVAHTLPLYTFANTSALPTVFVPASVRLTKTWRDDLFVTIGKSHPTVSVIECVSCDEGVFTNTGSVLVVSDIPGEMALSVTAGEKGTWVVINHAHLPSWRAFVDTTEVELHPANYIMQGILVPEGNHTIILLYR